MDTTAYLKTTAPKAKRDYLQAAYCTQKPKNLGLLCTQ